MIDYGFDEGKDFVPYQIGQLSNNKALKDSYVLTLNMAKELSMFQRS